MSLKEQTIILTDKDSQGNTIMQFPITKAKNIEDVMSIAQGGTGATTAKQARKNLEVEPIGTIFAFAGSSIPSGYLACNGGAISRTTYADLFAVIGTTYGRGDGSTTFNLPNLTDKFIQGSDTVGTVMVAGLPNITGRIGRSDTGTSSKLPPFWITDIREGAFTSSKSGGPFNDFASLSYYRNSATQYINFNASDSNSIYGNSDTVQPPALTMRYIIKY